MFNLKREADNFLKRLTFAFSGIISAFKRERNLHIQSIVAIIVIVSAILIHVTLTDFMIILILIGGVISLELVNTAIERAVDLTTQKPHPLAKAAKDTAAGAVLCFSIISVIIGFMILYKTLL
ncbi:diacylglycerol kinase family protein [Scopulibacillus cellulosilyticus]|uniref:Diacylglycerol kinase family protein n=1 Tax=Scopulibacillus cellulosilyticus TaxID=2665665 RepID=A0ABW2PXA8_9BACL